MNEFLKKLAEILEVSESQRDRRVESLSAMGLAGCFVCDCHARCETMASTCALLISAPSTPLPICGISSNLRNVCEHCFFLASSQGLPRGLEDLLFFNPRQHLVRQGIINSLTQFGHPRVEEAADGLSVRVGDHEAQTLFAFDRERKIKLLWVL